MNKDIYIGNFAVPPSCANTHNCLWPILGRWWKLKWVLMHEVQLHFILSWKVCKSALPCLIDPIPRSLRLTQNAYFSLLAHTKKLLLMTFCDQTAGIESVTGQDDNYNATADAGRTKRREYWNSYVDFFCRKRYWMALGFTYSHAMRSCKKIHVLFSLSLRKLTSDWLTYRPEFVRLSKKIKPEEKIWMGFWKLHMFQNTAIQILIASKLCYLCLSFIFFQ